MRLTFGLIDLCVIVVTVGMLSLLLLPPGDFAFTHPYPPAESPPGNVLTNDAGEYHQGATRGMHLDLSILPDSRYSLIWSGCTGVGYRESGHVRNTGGLYLLASTRPIGMSIARGFVPVRW